MPRLYPLTHNTLGDNWAGIPSWKCGDAIPDPLRVSVDTGWTW